MIRRFLLYFVGVLIGLFLIRAFFGDREYRFPYMPNERVLFHIQENPIEWTDRAECQWDFIGGDSLLLATFIADGEVDFENSKIRKVEQKTYVVKHQEKDFWLVFEDRDSLTIILGLEGGRALEEACD